MGQLECMTQRNNTSQVRDVTTAGCHLQALFDCVEGHIHCVADDGGHGSCGCCGKMRLPYFPWQDQPPLGLFICRKVQGMRRPAMTTQQSNW